jgi:hypothetical protein
MAADIESSSHRGGDDARRTGNRVDPDQTGTIWVGTALIDTAASRSGLTYVNPYSVHKGIL